MAIALMAWEEKFCLGLDEIDEQHKSLVDLINQIWESIIKRSDNQVIFSLIGELEKYTLRFPRFFVCQRVGFMLPVFSDVAL